MSAVTPYGDESSAAPWRVQSWPDLLHDLMPVGLHLTRPFVLAIDGHSGSGKTTAATHLAACVPGAVVVHTDDVAWWESFFGWDGLLRTGVLEPLHRGDTVAYRPPAWEARQRPGAIEAAATAPVVVIEGVGASRRSLTAWIDASVWVQSDYDEANRRGIARDAESGQGPDFWWEWMAEENPFLLADRPWERADAVICGTPDALGIPHDLNAEVLRGAAVFPSPG